MVQEGRNLVQRYPAMGTTTLKTLLSATVFLIISTSFAAAISTEQVEDSRPHVILIVADDLGWSDVSWNNPNVVMPHMHDLAMNGVILNYSYVQPTCTPTRAALMTGVYPFKMGLQKGVIRPTEPRGVPLRAKMLPQYLKSVGYETHAIGKWHLGFCSWDYTPLKRGFDTFYGFYTGASDHFTHKRATPLKGEKENSMEFLDLRNNTEPDDTKSGHYSTHLFGSVAEDIVRSRNPKDPMFMYLAFQSVHSPLQVPKNYSDIYSYVKDTNRRLYLGMVTAMDEAVGRLVTALEETGHYNNSVIIFTTDNGGPIRFGASNWPLRGGKATLWEGGIRAPAFIHSPLLPNPGTVASQLHHVTDWFSTIIDIAGGKVPQVDGISHWDAFNGNSDHPRDKMICNIQNVERFNAAVRFSDYKMLIGSMASVKWASSSPSSDEPGRPKHWDSPPFDLEDSVKERGNFTGTSAAISNNELRAAEASAGGIDSNNEYVNTNHKSLPDEGTDSPDEDTDYTDEDTNSADEDTDCPDKSTVSPDAGTDSPDELLSAQKSNDTDNGFSRSVRSLYGNGDLDGKASKKTFVLWGDMKNHPKLEWESEVLNTLGKFIKEKTKIRLFDIKADPEERNNLSAKMIHKLQAMINYLSTQLQHMIPVPPKIRSREGHPYLWKNVWASGWCKSKW
ncbi:arylsulfatase B-like [Macrobrachium rosenbergii]|uniref:arylsulfatase B-like n=1 Tax=Macrobrachium rosenbergii TaxID=79674 RepID=UPI0034D59E3D